MNDIIINYFKCAQSALRKPTLLEFRHPDLNTRLDICGIDPLSTLLVQDGLLFKDGVQVGKALDIFEHLALEPSQGFFPAYLGFFAYEFASYFDKPAHKGKRSLPDAFFRRYERGLVIDQDRIIHHDPLETGFLKQAQSLKARSLEPALSRLEFLGLIERIKNQIREGDVYQVNLSLPFYFDASDLSTTDLYEAMRAHNKSPYMGVIEDDNWSLLSGSPERLISVRNGRIKTRPIAGTKKRGHDSESDNKELHDLLSCPKEKGEHAMLVDLMRNDLHQVANLCGVSVDEDRTVEFYSHVMHLVSNLSAKTNKSLKAIFEAVFPGGTVTGAPKISVMKSIAELEASARGPYTGSLGYISGLYGCDFNILIRSIVRLGDKAWINTGAGIVIDSNPEQEWEEVQKKAQSINDILQQRSKPKSPRPPLIGPRIVPMHVPGDFSACRVLFMENHDSFSFNIIAALKNLKAQVHITHDAVNNLDDFTHVVLGPGPGNPASSSSLLLLIEQALKSSRPLLGICLGHQALGYYFGAAIKKLPMPVHGKSQEISHTTCGLFANLPSPLSFTRYHSLALAQCPPEFVVDAFSEDDSIMAIRHQSKPFFGLQFHPESYLSEGGNILLANFLSIKS